MATRDITSYRVYNPAAADIAKTVSGSAISTSVQPTLNKGRSTGLGVGATTHVNMTNIAPGMRGRTVFGSQILVSARQGVTGAVVSGSTSITSAANSSGLTLYTKAGHGLTVGTSIVVADTNGILSGPQRILAVPLSSTFRTDKPYVTGAGTLTYGTVQGTFATQGARNFLARRLASVTLRGVTSTLLRSGASEYQIRRSIHKVEHGRVTKTATAIRAGYWDEYNAVWTTQPTTSDDAIGNVAGSTVTNGTADHAATPTRLVPGEFVFRQGGQQTVGTGSDDGVKLVDYPERTG